MSTQIKHDSRSTLYRLPGGAMPAGSGVRIRLWASRAFKQVFLRVWTDCEQKIPMRALGAYDGGIMYEAELLLPGTPGLCWYYFVLSDGTRDYMYGNAYDHLGGLGRLYDTQPPSYQITVYDPAFMPPRWLREGAMYQIFPDRFFRPDIGACGRLKPAHSASTPDAKARAKQIEHANWYEKPLLDIAANGDNAARDFFGGNLRGIIAKLDYLKLLGVSVLYINPIFLSPSNHRYNTSDYLTIDPRVGTEDDLRELCAEAAKRGMRVMLDGVFSHTGDDSLYFNRCSTFPVKGACQGAESPYYDWYDFEHFPDKYRCWWGFDTLPEVNEDSPSFRRFICGPDASQAGADSAGDTSASQNTAVRGCPEGVVRHYLRMGVSGWRLDVADELPMDFLASLRRAARHERPDAAVLGEVWEDASNQVAYGQLRCYFKGDTLDSVMNYPLRDMAIDFMLGRISAQEFARRYSALAENYPKPALYALMNLIGSHDRARIINRMAGMDVNMPRDKQADAAIPEYALGLAKRRVAALWRLICALPGVPCVYYGDEAGAQGMGDPFNRGTYPWGQEDAALREEFSTALKVRNASQALLRGSVEVFTPCADVLVVLRRLNDGSDYAGVPSRAEAFMAIINRSLNAVSVCLNADKLSGVKGIRREGDMLRVELPALTTGYFG